MEMKYAFHVYILKKWLSLLFAASIICLKFMFCSFPAQIMKNVQEQNDFFPSLLLPGSSSHLFLYMWQKRRLEFINAQISSHSGPFCMQ